MSNLNAALALAGKGKPIFPCNSQKQPLIETGFKAATTDSEQVTAWWSRYPDALIGMPTGTRSGTVVLDVDNKDGRDGDETLFQLQHKHGQLPDTVQVLTPSGGRHLYFTHPGETVKNSVDSLGLGLDIRGDGGYVIVPPSRINGRGYEWEANSPDTLAAMPEWLIDLIGAPKEENPQTQPFDRGRVLAGVPEGQRDDALYRYACRLQAKGNTQAEAEVLVKQAAAACTPPFDEIVALAKVERVYQEYASTDPIGDLATLSPLEYDRVRDKKAKELGIRVTTLDNEVTARRATNVAQDSVAVVEELEPWPESVDGLKLANQIARTLADHVALPAGACTAVTLFAIGTYTMDSWRLWPKLLITSPEKRCGKSTLLEAIEATVHRPLLTASITASSLFRCIAAWTPTLLIDEADTFAKDNEELNGIINAGHTRRTATVVRSEKVGDVFEPRKFSVWCPQIIAGIKRQRDTLHDRSIHIQMRRKLPGETVNKLPYDLFERLRPLRQQAMRWALDNTGSLRASTPDVPHLGSDRAQDNWVPLFAIADAIGGNWPERARKAYTTLTDTGEADDTAGPMLLHDIKSVFDDKHRDHIFSTDLVRELIELEERPWCEWKHGRPMTKASLARLLRPFGVISGTVRIGTMTAKGYKRASFEDAWHRYLSDPPCQSVTTSQASQGAGLSQISKRHTTGRVTFSKSLKASQGAGCDVVTDENAPIETGKHITPPEPWEDDL